jgi:queuine tRNA-ribosyltransferase
LAASQVFSLLAADPHSDARAGELYTAHGSIPTPIFMPVGTLGSVKAVPQQRLQDDIGAAIILGNTYHLFQRPGLEVLEAAGGLHRFMSWARPILTDSGGFQVYSLAERRKISDEGVTFKSHFDGTLHAFTPENAVALQRSIGADIQMVLDECPPYPCEPDYARQATERTHRWAARARRQFLHSSPRYEYPQLQFGIVQGATDPALREASAQTIAAMDFEGNAIGGLSVGEPTEQLYDLTELCCRTLPPDKPRYLMGVGTPANLLECIGRGVDMFDCVLPTRNARHGKLYFWDGIRNLKAARYKQDFSPLAPDSPLPTDRQYSKAYLRHLYHNGEPLALTLGTLHNLHFYLSLIRTAREHILAGTFAAWRAQILPRLQQQH